MEKSKEQLVDEILDRGIIREFLPSKEEFKKALLTRKLRFYYGSDPTGTSLHLSHAKNLMLLNDFRKLGHEVIVLFGDFTACIGDPSDRSSVRARLTRDEVVKNAEYWIKNISPLIDFNDKVNPAKVVYNSTWLNAFTPSDFIELLSNATVQQMIERDMFQKRLEQNKPIFLHEFLYPMLQGYDSVALDVDVELCGTDQIFNSLVGRDLLRKYKNKEKFVIANNLMENPKTGELMSKSKGTGVFLGVGADKMFEDIMRQPDEMIEVMLINNTRIPLEDIKKLDIANNPREAKLFTAREITKIFYSQEEVEVAENRYKEVSNKEIPDHMEEIKMPEKVMNIVDIIAEAKLADSKSNARRLVQQNGIKLNGKVVSDIKLAVDLSQPQVISKGKNKFIKVFF